MSDYEFRIVNHTVRRNVEIVEVWYRGKLMATITPADELLCGLRVLSKHLCGVVDMGIAVQMIFDPDRKERTDG